MSGKPASDAASQRVSDALLDRRDVLLRDRAADLDRSSKTKPVPRSPGLDVDPHFAELARAAGLLLVDVVDLDLLAIVSRYATCGSPTLASTLNSRFMRSTQDFEVELAHARDDRLAGLVVGRDAEVGSSCGRRLSACRASPGRPWSSARSRADDRLGELHPLEHDRRRPDRTACRRWWCPSGRRSATMSPA